MRKTARRLSGVAPTTRRQFLQGVTFTLSFSDLGSVIQPDTVRAQLEGGVIFGLSNALYETVTIERGVPKETNFHDYRIMQLLAAPERVRTLMA